MCVQLNAYRNIQYNYWNWQRVVSPLDPLTPTGWMLFQRKTMSSKQITPNVRVRSGSGLDPPSSAFSRGASKPLVTIQSPLCPPPNSWQSLSCPSEVRYPNSYSTVLSFSHTPSLRWSASPKLPHSSVSAAKAVLDCLEHCYSRLPGHDTMVRVILPRSSFRRRTKAVWVIPQVLLPFTSSRMSPHLILPSL